MTTEEKRPGLEVFFRDKIHTTQGRVSAFPFEIVVSYALGGETHGGSVILREDYWVLDRGGRMLDFASPAPEIVAVIPKTLILKVVDTRTDITIYPKEMSR